MPGGWPHAGRCQSTFRERGEDTDDTRSNGSWAHFPVGRESRCNLSIQIESSKATTCRLHPSLLWSGVDNNNTRSNRHPDTQLSVGSIGVSWSSWMDLNTGRHEKAPVRFPLPLPLPVGDTPWYSTDAIVPVYL